jgi:hypothetical protein
MNLTCRRYILLSLVAISLTLRVSGQQIFTIRGVTSKNLSAERVAQVVINNLRSKDFMESDDLGWFAIKAAIGDTLLFTKRDYTQQKIVIKSSGDLPVYMQPVIQLAEVTIQGQTKRQELNEVMGDYKKDGTFYNGKPPVLSFLTSPITGLYELFGATPGRARRFAAFSKGEEDYAEVHRRYNLALVKRVTNTNDSVATKFMKFYTPSIDDLKEWNDYELIKHINDHYDFYNKSADKEKLENLNTPPPLIAPKKVNKNPSVPTIYQN